MMIVNYHPQPSPSLLITMSWNWWMQMVHMMCNWEDPDIVTISDWRSWELSWWKFSQCLFHFWSKFLIIRIFEQPITKVGLNRFKPISQCKNLELNLHPQERTKHDQTWTLGSVQGFKVWTEVLDWTLATLLEAAKSMTRSLLVFWKLWGNIFSAGEEMFC